MAEGVGQSSLSPSVENIRVDAVLELRPSAHARPCEQVASEASPDVDRYAFLRSVFSNSRRPRARNLQAGHWPQPEPGMPL